MAGNSSETRAYFKSCNTCDQRIWMQRLPSGRWMALNPDGTDHKCWSYSRDASLSYGQKRSPTSPRIVLVRPSTGRIRATAEHILAKVQGPLVQQHEFCVRAEIHWGPNQLKCLTAVRPLDEPSDGVLCDPRHVIFFGRTDSLHEIERKLTGWFDSHPDGAV